MAKTLENRQEFLFPEYSKRKLHMLSETYGELARLYHNIPEESYTSSDRKELLYQKQVHESKQIFAQHLKDISGALDEVSQTVMHVSTPVEHKRKAVVSFLRKHGIQVKEIMFLEGAHGKRKINITARLMGRHTYSADEFAGLLSVFFDRRLVAGVESPYAMTKNFEAFFFEDEPRYMVMSAMSRAVKENEKISGDNYSVEECSDGNVVLMIADGMGSGEYACRDSQSVIEFMEKFLDAGFQKEKAFSMINAAIAAQSQCCNLTTLDLCMLDLHDGEAEFIKAGAASSFHKRGGMVREIASDMLPLGSLMEISPMSHSLSLMDGDMIVMMSDGVTDCFEDESGNSRLCEVIARNHTVNPREMSDYLLQYAINCQGGRIRDDMTILTVGVWETRN
ncbi:MAG: SpoIIE family protein phosphatase [Lachnospiraceae bacterium]|nr:SpoIIE family protein phosphatase [Lachnospiraceae bacterium]MBQ6996139.1 SpoIIE family protein phosphatase [Lachnospiraceae bacterium]